MSVKVIPTPARLQVQLPVAKGVRQPVPAPILKRHVVQQATTVKAEYSPAKQPRNKDSLLVVGLDSNEQVWSLETTNTQRNASKMVRPLIENPNTVVVRVQVYKGRPTLVAEYRDEEMPTLAQLAEDFQLISDSQI